MERAERILRARNRSDFSNACFHAQQCAEKYMKAVLDEHGQTIDRVHDLSALLGKLTNIEPSWILLANAADAR